jgi:hypothetical protein|tara:strand:+ start:1241 stop:2926 length:1686 start_codon:yes stop_codon:yes gene_type:complete
MQYKEPKQMGLEEENVVKLNADGSVLKCAKDYSTSDCEYTAGSKICGKCGASAIELKESPMEQAIANDETLDDEDAVLIKALEEKASVMDEVSEVEAEKRRIEKDTRDTSDTQLEDDDDDPDHDDHEVTEAKSEDDVEEKVEDEPIDEKTEDDGWIGLEEEEKDEKAGVMMRESRLNVDDEEEEEEEEEEAPVAAAPPPAPPAAPAPPPAAAAPPAAPPPAEEAPPAPIAEEEEAPPAPAPAPALAEEEEEEEEEEEYDESSAKKSMGAYLCALDRKVYPGNASVCDDCPGGCVSEKGMPSLLEVEQALEIQFKGDEYATVIDSVYSDRADLFICDLDVDGKKVIEVFVEAKSGEVLGFSRLDDSVFEQKDAFETIDLVDFSEAAEIAVKTVEGVVNAVEPDVFESFDCYAVEINGVDGKSHDVFVALDGEVLGYDTYEPDEAEAIEAEAAEIALKRAFSDDEREGLAEEGHAMKDGSYPIVSEEDLRNAVQAYGRASNKSATKAHIMKRAKDLGLEELIPTNWVSGSNEKAIMSADDAEFMVSLIEFELLAEETNNNGPI